MNESANDPLKNIFIKKLRGYRYLFFFLKMTVKNHLIVP